MTHNTQYKKLGIVQHCTDARDHGMSSFSFLLLLRQYYVLKVTLFHGCLAFVDLQIII